MIAPATCRRQPLQDGGLERQVRDFHSACSGHRITCSSRRSRRKPSSTFSGYAALLCWLGANPVLCERYQGIGKAAGKHMGANMDTMLSVLICAE